MKSPTAGAKSSGNRIGREEALALFHSHDLFALAERAQQVRFAHNPKRIVTYNVNRNINYTNVCDAGCKFCAFYRREGDKDAYTLEEQDFIQKIEELVSVGGTEVLLQGGHHPELRLAYYEDLLRFLTERFPGVTVHGFSPPEIVHLAERVEKKSIRDILEALKAAGLRSMPGGGAEILVDSVRRKMAAAKCTAGQWLEVMETAHALGIGTTATMMFGHIESLQDRVEHLERLRALQDRTGGFRAFIAWTFQDKNCLWEGRVKPSKGSFDYLRTLALSRIFLDNFPHVQASYVTQSLKIGQVALHFGADDLGGTMLEENVVRMAGANYCHTNEQELRVLIQEAGFAPQKRDTFYRSLEESR